MSELGLAQSEIAFRQHIQHTRTVTLELYRDDSPLVQQFFSDGNAEEGSGRWLSRRTSGYYTTRTEGRRTENRKLSYSELWSVPRAAGIEG